MPNARRPSALRPLAVLALLLPATLAAGCIGAVIPTGAHGHTTHGAHAPIDDRAYGALTVGQFTKDDVRQRLGRWDVELAGGDVWVYAWETKVDLGFWWFVASIDGAADDDGFLSFSKTHYLLLAFDARDGILRDKRRKRGGRVNIDARGIDDALR